MSTKLYIVQLDTARDLPLPFYATEGSSGMDLHASVIEDTIIPKGKVKLIPTGIKIAIEQGYEAQVRPRSGLALKNGISVLNTPGTIDSDYRGEVCVILINLGDEDFVVTRGMRVAQMVIAKVEHVTIEQVDDLNTTSRGEGGFGSTGVNLVKENA